MEKQEACAVPSYAEDIQALAKWQWCLEADDGRFIASMAIVPDFSDRGWFVAYPGSAIKTGVELRPLFRVFNILAQAKVYGELRAWVAHNDARAIRFAKSFGFVYDCGPAAGFSPTGRDMDLFLWRSTQ